MANESGNDSIHWKLLLLQTPQWTVGLVTLILGSKVLMDPLFPDTVEESKSAKMFLEYATACGAWSVIVLPIVTLLFLFPTPIAPPKNMRRMAAAVLLEFLCILLWFALLIWNLKGYDFIECDFEKCENFIKPLKYFSILTIFMTLLTALVYHNFDKKQRKKRQAEIERTMQEYQQQPRSEMRGSGTAVSMIEEERSLEMRPPNYIAESMGSQASLVRGGGPLEMRSPSYITNSTHSRVSSIQEVVLLEMTSPSYIISSAPQPRVGMAQPPAALSPNNIANSSRSQVDLEGGDVVVPPTSSMNAPQDEAPVPLPASLRSAPQEDSDVQGSSV